MWFDGDVLFDSNIEQCTRFQIPVKHEWFSILLELSNLSIVMSNLYKDDDLLKNSSVDEIQERNM